MGQETTGRISSGIHIFSLGGRTRDYQHVLLYICLRTLTPGTPYGYTQFNSMFGPRYVETDLSLFNTLPIKGETSIQVRGEVFNAFNNVNLDAPQASLNSPTFGTISGSGAPRIVQLAFRLSF
jgi:hypothetical protein